MEYTIQQLAQLAGVTRRALRHYDQIGLLKPAHTTQAGWRLYGAAQVDRLQQILFYRALGLELEHIRRLLDDPAFDRRTALQSHLTELKDRRGRLDALILTVQKTLDAEQGGNRMPDTDKFECFKQDMIQKNEAQYGPELRARYGDALVDRANARLAGLTREQYDAMTTLEDEIRRDLTAAVLAGDAPDGPAGRMLAEKHRRWLSASWEQPYTPQAHAALAALYTQDKRFTDYYDQAVPGCAAFLRRAVEAYTAPLV